MKHHWLIATVVDPYVAFLVLLMAASVVLPMLLDRIGSPERSRSTPRWRASVLFMVGGLVLVLTLVNVMSVSDRVWAVRDLYEEADNIASTDASALEVCTRLQEVMAQTATGTPDLSGGAEDYTRCAQGMESCAAQYGQIESRVRDSKYHRDVAAALGRVAQSRADAMSMAAEDAETAAAFCKLRASDAVLEEAVLLLVDAGDLIERQETARTPNWPDAAATAKKYEKAVDLLMKGDALVAEASSPSVDDVVASYRETISRMEAYAADMHLAMVSVEEADWEQALGLLDQAERDFGESQASVMLSYRAREGMRLWAERPEWRREWKEVLAALDDADQQSVLRGSLVPEVKPWSSRSLLETFVE